MLRMRLFTIILAGFAGLSECPAASITEDFSSDPFQKGWRVFGDTNLFQWDAQNQNLRVTWDSSQPNSYFHLPLGTILTRSNDFSIAFDLRLSDIGVGSDTNKASSFPIAVGFLNLDIAAGTNFVRGTGSGSPELAEVAYFWDSGFGATLWPTFVDANSTFNYNDANDYAIFALSPGDGYHIVMTYTASNQTAVTTVTNFGNTSGIRISQLLNTNFTDFRLGSVSISSYSDAGQDPQYPGSVLAHGTVDNMVATFPAGPVGPVVGAFSNQAWQVHFAGQAAWLYTLERTLDYQSWTAIAATAGSANVLLVDTNPPTGAVYYRVRAERP